jgi:hypothetical protein
VAAGGARQQHNTRSGSSRSSSERAPVNAWRACSGERQRSSKARRSQRRDRESVADGQARQWGGRGLAAWRWASLCSGPVRRGVVL